MRVTPSVTPMDLLPANAAESRPMIVQVASNDLQSLEAAAQIVVATAAITQQVRPVSITATSASIGNQPGLIVAPVNRLAGKARDAYLDTLETGNARLQNSQVGRFFGVNSTGESKNGLLASLQDHAGSAWRSMGFKLETEVPAEHAFALQKSDILIAQRTDALSSREGWVAFMGAPVRQDTWTIVTGLTSEDIKSGVGSLLKEGRLASLAGDTALYQTGSNRIVSDRLSEPNYFASLANPAEFRNSRLVVAGLVSHNMLDFVAFMLALCFLLAFTYFVALKRSGR
jgi:hypothetical protein